MATFTALEGDESLRNAVAAFNGNQDFSGYLHRQLRELSMALRARDEVYQFGYRRIEQIQRSQYEALQSPQKTFEIV